jgi:UDP-N-acetyl-D-mannosaminuronic acid transferase (WecB/TagA/CpsF family)
MRRAGLEWLFRLGLEPRRLFRRYVLGNPVFLMRAPALAAAMRRGARPGGGDRRRPAIAA